MIHQQATLLGAVPQQSDQHGKWMSGFYFGGCWSAPPPSTPTCPKPDPPEATRPRGGRRGAGLDGVTVHRGPRRAPRRVIGNGAEHADRWDPRSGHSDHRAVPLAGSTSTRISWPTDGRATRPACCCGRAGRRWAGPSTSTASCEAKVTRRGPDRHLEGSRSQDPAAGPRPPPGEVAAVEDDATGSGCPHLQVHLGEVLELAGPVVGPMHPTRRCRAGRPPCPQGSRCW